MKSVDYLVVGQGIAGSVLAFELIKRGYSVQVIDQQEGNSSSLIAAGLYNPITGRKMVLTWLAHQIFDYCKSYYDEMEAYFARKFHHSLPIYRPFINEEEIDLWSDRQQSDTYGPFVSEVFSKSRKIDHVDDPYGGIVLNRTGYVDLPLLLNTVRKWLIDKGIYRNEMFSYEEIKTDHGIAIYRDLKCKKVLFCEGTGVANNPYWNHLHFKPVKGEVIEIERKLDINFILNRGVFMIPKGHFCTVGSTYDHADLSTVPSQKGINTIIDRLKKIFSGPIVVINSRAGIRPATKDRRPYIGLSIQKHIGIFNGFGTKGVSLVPYFASMFVDFLEERGELIADVLPDRHTT